ncbi:hypothetical protein FSP39_016016 [Pinctada imbricata]|uniref:FAD/NAD(P)-binding domain-containing protein n=1 Tax=Pinctada imbricata TaxID=66713 RepID=A0AA88Y465_PINIB|nr:hypothetical protein FSP39_016016 [Pinctada imbricata]
MSYVGSDVGVRGSKEQEETGVLGEKPLTEAWVGDHLPSNIRLFAESGIRTRDLRGEKRARYHCAKPAFLSSLWPEEEVLLITASPLIKAITNYKKITKNLEDFDVEERPILSLRTECPNVKVITDTVKLLDSQSHVILLKSGKTIQYKKCCICTGGKPKLISDSNPHVLGIRDTESVQEFQKRLSSARRIVVVGNGGIATELVYEIEGCEVIWAIKDKSIASTFVDAGAAEFFLPHLNKPKSELEEVPSKRLKYTVGGGKTDEILIRNFKILLILNFLKDAILKLNFVIANDGGIKVNDKMQTTVSNIYAAGDVCSASWELAPHWIQV